MTASKLQQAIEKITVPYQVTTPDGTYRVVGVSRSDRLILGENRSGEIFKLYPHEIIAIQPTAARPSGGTSSPRPKN